MLKLYIVVIILAITTVVLSARVINLETTVKDQGKTIDSILIEILRVSRPQ